MNVVCGRCGNTSATALRCPECGYDASQNTIERKAPSRARRLIVSIFVLGAIGMLGFGFLAIDFPIRIYYTPSGAMEPTLQINDMFVAEKIDYHILKPHDGDIVVFPPPIPSKNDFIKRVIGSPGEKLRMIQGTLYRNDVPFVEPYVAQKTAYDLEIKNYNVYVDGVPLDRREANVPPRDEWSAPDTIPPDCYLMLGDNRNNSEDSHIWGFAQLGGTFATGPEAGHAASFSARATDIIWHKSAGGIKRT